MANYFLRPVYQNIFDEEFNPSSFEQRLMMQKTIYLLQDLGVSVGNYNYMWYKHGPYSQSLQNDILCMPTENVKVKFSNEAMYSLNKLKCAINKPDTQYSKPEWAECLGSLHYIKENLLPSSATNDDILSELVRRKPHLNNAKDNENALQTLNALFS